jgi:hypothetical protein
MSPLRPQRQRVLAVAIVFACISISRCAAATTAVAAAEITQAPMNELECNGCSAARCSKRFVDASCWWNPDASDGNATHALAAALATRAQVISIPAMDRP